MDKTLDWCVVYRTHTAHRRTRSLPIHRVWKCVPYTYYSARTRPEIYHHFYVEFTPLPWNLSLVFVANVRLHTSILHSGPFRRNYDQSGIFRYYDGIYRQKLSTDYCAHVAMNIYLYLMNIYTICDTWTSQVSGEQVTFAWLYHMHTAFNQNTWFQHSTLLYCTC